MWYSGTKMRKILPFLVLLIFFTSLEAKSEDYYIEEKTSDYVIVVNKNRANIGGRFLSSNLHYAIPTVVIDAVKNTEDLEKRFNIAENYCTSLNKPTILIYRLIPGRKTWDLKFFTAYDLRIFDEDISGEFSKLRFFCADDNITAARLYDKLTFINENGKNILNTETAKKFKSTAGQKYTTETSENSNWKFDLRETEEVRSKKLERITAERIKTEQEKQRTLELAALEEKKLYEKKKEKEKKSKLIELEKVYGKKCQGGPFQKDLDKKTQNFNNCLLEQEAKELNIKKQQSEKLALAEEKKQKAIDEKNRKIAFEQNKIQKAVQEKQLLDQAKIKEEQTKVSKMKPEDRNAYTCSEKFGFRKGSDKFKDCIFELYKAEAELEKLELQKQVAKANAEAARASAEVARASADRQERLALAQTEAAKMQSLAARQQAIAANTADSLALIESGLRMMSPQRPAPRMQTSCTYVGRFLNCF